MRLAKQFDQVLHWLPVQLHHLTWGLLFNPFALRTAKTLWSFGCSECNRVKALLVWHEEIVFTDLLTLQNLIVFLQMMRLKI